VARVFIVDDHPVLLETLRTLLEFESDLEVCGEAQSAENAIQLIDSACPDIVLTDVSLPGKSGIELGAEIRGKFPDLPFVMFSGHGERSYVRKALEAGAAGYIFKGDWEEFPIAIRQALAGEQYLSQSVKM
jgi:DNA-binding NarL/FixJ family response regulator